MPEDDAARYLVMRPNGQDGPYSLADLRQLAGNGRLQADDRILDTVGRTPSTAAQLIPGLVGTDSQARVRRTRTSDRLPAQSHAPHPKSERTPLPTTSPAPQAAAEGVGEYAAPPVQAKPKRPAAWAIALLAAAAVFAAISLVMVLGDSPQEASVQAEGRWTLADLPRHGGPWTIDVLSTEIVIRPPDGGGQSFGWTVLQRDEQRCIVRLERPHPVLGERLVFTLRDGKPAMSISGTVIPAEHVPPL